MGQSVRYILGAVLAMIGVWPLMAGDVTPVPVIQTLNIEALDVGKHQFYLKVPGFRRAKPQHIPLLVLKGANAGKRLLLTAAVHGDELNGIRVIQTLFQNLEVGAVSGTLIAVPGVNQAGLKDGSRYYTLAPGSKSSDLNRAFPGGLGAAEATHLFAAQLWEQLFKNNADMAVDIHTQAIGAAYPFFIFADYSDPFVQDMAEALLPDIIKQDQGHRGTLETAFMASGIPAVTMEIGESKRLAPQLVERAVSGLQNLMRSTGMLKGEIIGGKPFVGTAFTDVSAEAPGFAVIKVRLLDIVQAGDEVAVLYDPFGELIKRYHAPHSGIVLALATNPLRDKGNMLVRIIR